MDEVMSGDVTSGESSQPATDASGTVGAPPSTAPQGQSIPYDRFREVNQERNYYRNQHSQLQNQYNQLAQQMAQFRNTPQPQYQPQAPQALPEGYDEGGKILANIMRQHPEFRTLNQLQQALPELLRGYQQTGQVMQALQEMRQQVTTERVINESARLGQIAKSAGLPSDQQSLEVLSYQVKGLIEANPQAHRAYLNGDRSVLDRAVTVIKNHYAAASRNSAAALNTAKNRTAALPPRSAGGQPGVPPGVDFKKMSEGDFFKRGGQLLAERLAERA